MVFELSRKHVVGDIYSPPPSAARVNKAGRYAKKYHLPFAKTIGKWSQSWKNATILTFGAPTSSIRVFMHACTKSPTATATIAKCCHFICRCLILVRNQFLSVRPSQWPHRQPTAGDSGKLRGFSPPPQAAHVLHS